MAGEGETGEEGGAGLPVSRLCLERGGEGGRGGRRAVSSEREGGREGREEGGAGLPVNRRCRVRAVVRLSVSSPPDDRFPLAPHDVPVDRSHTQRSRDMTYPWTGHTHSGHVT